MASRRTSNTDARGGPVETAAGPAPQSAALLYSIAALLSLVGIADAIYLTIEHLTGQSVRCTITTGCDEVLSSAYASIHGIPLAAFGALAYFTAFSLATLAAFGYQRVRTAFGLLVALMLLMTLWLLFLQAFVIHRYCQYCLLSAAVTLSLAVIVIIARRREQAGRMKAEG